MKGSSIGQGPPSCHSVTGQRNIIKLAARPVTAANTLSLMPIASGQSQCGAILRSGSPIFKKEVKNDIDDGNRAN